MCPKKSQSTPVTISQARGHDISKEVTVRLGERQKKSSIRTYFLPSIYIHICRTRYIRVLCILDCLFFNSHPILPAFFLGSPTQSKQSVQLISLEVARFLLVLRLKLTPAPGTAAIGHRDLKKRARVSPGFPPKRKAFLSTFNKLACLFERGESNKNVPPIFHHKKLKQTSSPRFP